MLISQVEIAADRELCMRTWAENGCTDERKCKCCQVASRRVIQVEAVYMLLFGMIGKFGALFVTIPQPVIGGVFLVMFGEY